MYEGADVNIIKIGREYLAGKWGWVAAILALQLAQIIFSLFLPSINAAIIDDGILKKDIPTIWRLGGAMLGLTALQLICSVIAVIVSSRLSLDFGRRLRRDISTTSNLFPKLTATISAHRPSLLARPTTPTKSRRSS